MTDAVYDAVKDVINDGCSYLEVINLIIKTMKEVGRLRNASGENRKQTVLVVVRRVIEDKLKDGDKDKALGIVQDIGPEVVEGLYWAGKQSKRVFSQAKRWCC
jgi:hypothetical protein